MFGVEQKSMNAHSKEKKNDEGLYCMIQSDSMERSSAENIFLKNRTNNIISFNTILVFNVHVKNW